LIPSPTLKVLSTMQKHEVKALLMGGQACVWYGGAEFSRDTDLVVLSERENLQRLLDALHELNAERIAVPPFQVEYLERGHAVHFRCQHPEARGMRVDIMSKMRGVSPFEELWSRRETLQDEDGNVYELLSLPDLVRAKKTQREKDWPMLRRLMEAHYFEHGAAPTSAQIDFWLRELRTPELLTILAAHYPEASSRAAEIRPLLKAALAGDIEAVSQKLNAEMLEESAVDRLYWAPLKRELEAARKKHRNSV
jgi:hypothetical protein